MAASKGAMSQQKGGADAEFREVLEELISRKKGRAIRIAEMQREPSKWVTLFPAEVVTISDTLGHRHSIFVKYLGSEQSDHPDKQVRDRETRVYEELLTDASLPCAEFYGWRRNEGSGRIELFLEYVDDWVTVQVLAARVVVG